MDDYIGLIIGAVIIFSAAFYWGWCDGYKGGQIDAINGKIKYELVTHEDKTQTWEEIKGNK